MEPDIKNIVETKIHPYINYYFEKIYREKDGLTIDGVKVFNSKDRFFSGKIVNAVSCVVTDKNITSEKEKEYINMAKDIISFVMPIYTETWGDLNYLIGIYRLKIHDKLEFVVDDKELENLKKKLDWRKFVNVQDLSLIDKPTNYYGVALGIARYRELLGWDEEGYSNKLLNQLMNHIEKYSSGNFYMDETEGQGRFDRYSLLIPAEICNLLIGTKMEVPEMLIKMLRKSCTIFLNLANVKGNGISYGRSIGAHGDTAILQILSTAAELDVLTQEEKELAYGYCTKIYQKFVSFWIDTKMKSVNLWEKGRGTDSYRHKGRILGESLSLFMMLMGIYEQWEKMGYGEKQIVQDFEKRVDNLPKYSFYRFVENEYDRGIAVIRDKNHVFSLPLINGGGGNSGDTKGFSYYYATPYLPIPSECSIMETPADTFYAQLVPRIVLKDGKRIMPISYIKDITTKETDGKYEVRYRQEEMCVVGEGSPQKDERMTSETTYTFSAGTIERKDIFKKVKSLDINEIYMDFCTFSKNGQIQGHKIVFKEGPIEEIAMEGLNLETIDEIKKGKAYHTSHGALNTHIIWKKQLINHESITIKWMIKYR